MHRCPRLDIEMLVGRCSVCVDQEIQRLLPAEPVVRTFSKGIAFFRYVIARSHMDLFPELLRPDGDGCQGLIWVSWGQS